MKTHKAKKKLNKNRSSAVDDCADVTSRYERYKKNIQNLISLQLNIKNLLIINLR